MKKIQLPQATYNHDFGVESVDAGEWIVWYVEAVESFFQILMAEMRKRQAISLLQDWLMGQCFSPLRFPTYESTFAHLKGP